MKKFITLLTFCLSSTIATAQDGIAGLTNHSPIVLLYLDAINICKGERFETQLTPNEKSIEKYRNCVTNKKASLETNFISSNKYLKEKGFTQSQASLKKYYISLISLLSLPEITYKENTYQRLARESIESDLQRAIESDWALLATEIKLGQ
jgi:hypothetical protein